MNLINPVIDEHSHLNILTEHLAQSARQLCVERCSNLQQNNVLKHTAKLVQKLLRQNTAQLETLLQSLDMKPIEILWRHLGANLEGTCFQQKPKTKIILTLQKEWIPHKYLVQFYFFDLFIFNFLHTYLFIFVKLNFCLS